MKNIFNETLESLETTLIEAGFKSFNARQIFEWMYKKNTLDFTMMSNLSKPLRTYLNEQYTFGNITMFSRQVAKDGTIKYLFQLHDGHLIESVLMTHDYGISLCVTTQVGCNIGCSFCASGLQKKIRNLSIAEMVMQFVCVVRKEKISVTHVVIMGTGEPFDNFENVMGFIDVINCPYGIEIGARHITVSTSGIVPKIDEFATYPKQVNLAISLHAPNDTIRTKLMPINKVYPMDALLKSVRRYIEKTNRRVTFEYILMDNINDSIANADELSDKLRGINGYVNLIRYNEVEEFSYQASKESKADAFHKRLMKRGIQATLRKELGSDIDAACGQLRSKAMKEH